MNDTVTSKKIQQLEQHHLELIDELDALNCRLEQVLNSFGAEKDDNSSQ